MPRRRRAAARSLYSQALSANILAQATVANSSSQPIRSEAAGQSSVRAGPSQPTSPTVEEGTDDNPIIIGSLRKERGLPSPKRKRARATDIVTSEPPAKRLRSYVPSDKPQPAENIAINKSNYQNASSSQTSRPPERSVSEDAMEFVETSSKHVSPPQPTSVLHEAAVLASGPSRPPVPPAVTFTQNKQLWQSLSQPTPGSSRTTDVPTMPINQPFPFNTAKPASPTKSKKGKQKEPEEKRVARFKPKCPNNIMERVERVTQQRFFMIERERDGDELQEKFSVLGSTGNVYTVRIGQVPTCNCPDASKGNHCKHILFIFLKVLHVPRDSHCWYQKALLTSELEDIFAKAPKAPHAVPRATNSVLAAYHRATGKADDLATASEAPPDTRRIPGPDDDCPICYETMHSENVDRLKFCESCNNAIHSECFAQWAASTTGRGQKLTCVWCRASWVLPTAAGGGIPGNAKLSREGYLNLAEASGMSTVRDTSTYYHGPASGRKYFGYREYD